MTTPGGFFLPIPNDPVINSYPAIVRDSLGWLFWHRNRTTGQCNPRHKTLARELHKSERTIQRCIRFLREGCVIRAVKGKRGNQYEITPNSEWRKPPVRTPVSRQEWRGKGVLSIYEGETLFLNESQRSEAAAAFSDVVERGGGDSPAALPEKTKTPEPEDEPPQQQFSFNEPERTTQPRMPMGSSNAAVPATPRPSAAPAVNSERTAGSERPLANRGESATLSSAQQSQAVALVAELLPQHPVAGNPVGAVRAVAAAIEGGATTEAIRESHLQFRRLWENFKPGRFIPMLARWIQENDWRFPPDERQIAKSVQPITPQMAVIPPKPPPTEEEKAQMAREESEKAARRKAREAREWIESLEFILTDRYASDERKEWARSELREVAA